MRSLAGDRDSEIAVAMWQPSHTLQRPFDANAPKLPRGDVHCFRMSVWGEHMDNGGSKEGTEAMMDPASLDCVHRVQELAAVRHLRARHFRHHGDSGIALAEQLLRSVGLWAADVATSRSVAQRTLAFCCSPLAPNTALCLQGGSCMRMRGLVPQPAQLI